MTQSTIDILTFWFSTAWRFLTSFYFPGTNVTPASMLLFSAAAVIGLRFIKHIFFTGGNNDNQKD